MSTLNPAPSELGLSSPALGPWFSEDLIIPAPESDLSVGLNISDDVHWLPPAGGLFSLFVAENPRPEGLAGLRDALGRPAFTDGRLVALFRLLPGVEERLHSLVHRIPPAEGDSEDGGDLPTRARIRYLALELGIEEPTLNMLESRLHPPLVSGWSEEEKAAHLGLRLNGVGLASGESPMFDLKHPGMFREAEGDRLLISLDCSVRLWAFDAGGRAVDPGAVAAWWRFLADETIFDNLWAEGLEEDDRRTASTEEGLALHLVNAHEGPIPIGSTLLGRLDLTNVDGDEGPLRFRGDDDLEGARIAFGGAQDPDDAPVPRVGVLPAGTYGEAASLWPSGPVHTLLTRDFVRVAVLDVEEHLVGQKRTTEAESGTIAARRAADQERVSTRIPVARSAGPALLPTTDVAAGEALGVFAGDEPTYLVTSVLDRDWGDLGPDSLPDLPDVAPPVSLPGLDVSALIGGGTPTGGTVAGQRVLVEMTFEDPSLAGAWVRAWPQGFDAVRGRRFRMDGGAGRVRADGAVSLIVRLPDGGITPADTAGGENTPASTTARMGVDIVVVTGRGGRFFMDQRFERPTPVGGLPLDIGEIAGEVVICETGEVLTPDSLAGMVPPGATLFALVDEEPALIDRAALPSSAFTENTLIRSKTGGDVVELTQPAFRSVPEGDAEGALEGTDTRVRRRTRQGLQSIIEAGAPLPTMERLEIACTRVGADGARAAIAATPALGRYHELLPHQLGHPGAPAAVEIHGTGVVLSGPAALAAAEFTRDRTAGSTINLIREAASPPVEQEEPATPGVWAACLRTVAAGVEAEIDPNLTGHPYPFGDSLDAIRDWLAEQEDLLSDHEIDDWLQGQEIEIPEEIEEAAESIVRVLDRRMMIAARGAREAATSLMVAIGRAEDFVYIETPALDNTTLGVEGDELALLQVLKDRMIKRPALRVLVCVPIRHMPGTPTPLRRVRDELLLEAVKELRAKGADRVAVFSPSAGPGRTLRLASTSVIVDDAYALTGTTHLWRRGLSFDSSLAVAVFDETLDRGRPKDVRRFRRRLVGDRLGLPVELVPDDPVEMVDAVRSLGERDGLGRLTTDRVAAPDPEPTGTDRDIWNRDGSPQPGFDPIGWIAGLSTDVIAGLEEEVTPAP